jgi:hypothetical protein
MATNELFRYAMLLPLDSRGLAQTSRHQDKPAAPRFAMFEAWAFLLPRASDFPFLHATFPRAGNPNGSSVTATPSRSMVYLRHAQSAAPLLWRGVLALHHH